LLFCWTRGAGGAPVKAGEVVHDVRSREGKRVWSRYRYQEALEAAAILVVGALTDRIVRYVVGSPPLPAQRVKRVAPYSSVAKRPPTSPALVPKATTFENNLGQQSQG
jgi:hypothetical protein